VLVVCEVKTRSSVAYGHPHEAVTATKVARLTELGLRWQESHGVRAEELRIDLVCVVRPRKGPSTLDHVRGVV
jgi:putative endonuclease